MKRVVKLADVAKAAGVSQGTASNVFNRPEIVSPAVRDRVKASAAALGYGGPDPRGRLLRAGKVNAIGFVSADSMAHFFHDPYYRLLLAGIAEVCDEHGAGIALVSVRSHQDAAWSVETALVDGFIVHCLEDGDRLLALTRRRNLPFVAVDLDAGPGTSSVVIDDHRGAYLAARHLLGLGHRRIGLLALARPDDGRSVDTRPVGSVRFKVRRDRFAGYAAALAEHGIKLESLPLVEVPSDRQLAVGHATDLLAQAPDLTAILAMSDILALAAMEAARQRGLRVPEDLSVVGFDDIPDAALATPPLTTVAQPIVEKGRRAAKLIFEGVKLRRETMKVSLVVRGSTARLSRARGVHRPMTPVTTPRSTRGKRRPHGERPGS